MRIALDISPLTTGHAGRGTGTYTNLLLKGLRTYKDKLDIVTFSNKDRVPSHVDVVHVPYFDPFFLTLRNFYCPYVITIHDLIPLVYKEHFPVGIKGSLKWHIQKHKAQKAQHVITDSFASRLDIMKILQKSENDVTPIYLCVDDRFIPQTQQKIAEIKQKYRLPDTFFLYVGDINWNKNIPTLIEAISLLDYPLVLVGRSFLKKDIPEMQIIHAAISRFKAEQKIQMITDVTDEDLPGVYSAAKLTLQVSIAEGFGLPVLESMASGTPCVVSNTSSLKEIAGPSQLVNPNDVASIRQGIHDLLIQDRLNMRKLCIDWASTFTLESMIIKTVEIYKHVVSS